MTNAMYVAKSMYDDSFYSKSEIRIRKNKIRRQRIVKRQYMLLMSIATIIIFLSIFMATTLMSDAKSEDYVPSFKYYKSITVHSGDTLWNIASENFVEDEYSDVNEYIAEIMSINNMKNSDSVKAGENLIIPYYSSTFTN